MVASGVGEDTTRSWRLLADPPSDGRWNMAVDRAIQIAREAGEVPATLRLYRWRRPTVTLGRFQDPSGIDWGACRRWDVDVVRRFTGGRGVLHDDELTYAIIAGLKDGVPRGTAASYRHLSQGLVQAYVELGVDAHLTERPRGEAGNAACYLHSTRADLSAGLAKLAGSAQTWVGSTCMQHGSFTVSRRLDREAEVFRLDETATSALAETTATLSTLGSTVSGFEALSQAVVRGISVGLGVQIEPGELTKKELELAEGLLAEVGVEGPVAG